MPLLRSLFQFSHLFCLYRCWGLKKIIPWSLWGLLECPVQTVRVPCSGDEPEAARAVLTAEGGLASRRERGSLLPAPCWPLCRAQGLPWPPGPFSSLAAKVHPPTPGQSFSFSHHSLPWLEELCSAARHSRCFMETWGLGSKKNFRQTCCSGGD